MSNAWYVHIDGQVLGPLTQDAVTKMLSQNRLSFVDYLWCDSLLKWHRVLEVDEFAKHLPAYPEIPIPSIKPQENETKKTSSPAVSLAKVESAKPIAKKEPEAKKIISEAKSEQKAEPVKEKKSVPAKKAEKIKGLKSNRVWLEESFVEIEGHKPFAILNLSDTGLFLQSEKPIEIGTTARLSVRLSQIEKPLLMDAIVVRHGEAGGKKGFAVQFRRLNPAHKRLLLELIEKFLED